MNLNGFIDIAEKAHTTQQKAAIEEDGKRKAQFALEMMQRMPKAPPAPADPPKIPSLGALAIPN